MVVAILSEVFIQIVEGDLIGRFILTILIAVLLHGIVS